MSTSESASAGAFTSESLRLFVAVDLDDERRAEAGRIIDEQRATMPHARWLAAGQLHVTLSFLGQVEQPSLQEVRARVLETAGRYAPFKISIGAAGGFPNARRPSVVWLGVEEGSDWLKALQRDLEQRLGEAGFAIENRAYSPHLTLGRVMKSGGSLEELVAWIRRTQHYNAGPTHVDEVLVMSSVQERGSTLYHIVCRAPLGG